ncbi:hypothetical protein Q8F55_001189 [Vanrija albida]|uniref:Uncharacterized protein n=1 Tax=Vanrija albida TaxID=181172 RepID=A0ABR3QFB4_9TREE
MGESKVDKLKQRQAQWAGTPLAVPNVINLLSALQEYHRPLTRDDHVAASEVFEVVGVVGLAKFFYAGLKSKNALLELASTGTLGPDTALAGDVISRTRECALPGVYLDTGERSGLELGADITHLYCGSLRCIPSNPNALPGVCERVFHHHETKSYRDAHPDAQHYKLMYGEGLNDPHHYLFLWSCKWDELADVVNLVQARFPKADAGLVRGAVTTRFECVLILGLQLYVTPKNSELYPILKKHSVVYGRLQGIERANADTAANPGLASGFTSATGTAARKRLIELEEADPERKQRRLAPLIASNQSEERKDGQSTTALGERYMKWTTRYDTPPTNTAKGWNKHSNPSYVLAVMTSPPVASHLSLLLGVKVASAIRLRLPQQLRSAIEGEGVWFKAVPTPDGLWSTQGTRVQVWRGDTLSATFGLDSYDDRTPAGPSGLAPAETFQVFTAFLDYASQA